MNEYQFKTLIEALRQQKKRHCLQFSRTWYNCCVYPYILIFIFLGVQIGQVKKYNDQDGATPLMEEIPND